MRRPISVQLYSFRDRAATDFAGVLRDLSEMGYKGVETCGLAGKTAGEVRRIVDDLGLVVSSAHSNLPSKDNLNEIVDTARTLGYEYIISGLGADAFRTMDAIKAGAERFQAAAELLKPHIPAILKAAGRDTTWLVVELDACASDMTQAVRDSVDYLSTRP